MKPEFEPIPLQDTGERFEIEFNGNHAFIDYRRMGSQIALNHTEADILIAGTGAAEAVVEKRCIILKIIRKKRSHSVLTYSHLSGKILNGNV